MGVGEVRIREIDFLKAVLIILMVSFHLVYFEHLHPYAKQVVYTFHMPGFLLLSGFLMKTERPARPFLRTMLWLAVPYVVMESGYIIMASVLPINEHIDQLTPTVFLDRLLLHPLGPYWYLHTMVLCGLTYYGVSRISRCSTVSRFLLTGILFLGYAYVLGIVSPANALYFLSGAVIRQSRIPLLTIFQASPLAVVAFAVLVMPGVEPLSPLILYCAFSGLLFCYPYVRGRLRAVMLFLGRNTLPLFLFSPLFTILCKQLVPYVQFDPTGLVFLAISLTVCIAGSLGVAWLLDTCHMSPLLFGRQRVIAGVAADTAKSQSC